MLQKNASSGVEEFSMIAYKQIYETKSTNLFSLTFSLYNNYKKTTKFFYAFFQDVKTCAFYISTYLQQVIFNLISEVPSYAQ